MNHFRLRRNSSKDLKSTFSKDTEIKMTLHEQSRDSDLIPVGRGTVTTAMLEKAKFELQETDENIEKGLQNMKKLIHTEKLICCEEDAYILRFLRVKKYEVRKSFEAFKQFTNGTSTLDKYCGLPDAEAIKRVLRNNLCVLLPYRDFDGVAVSIFRLGLWKPEDCGMGQLINAIMTSLYYLFEDPATQINGYSAIYDFRIIPRHHIPQFIKYFSVYLSVVGGFPGRVRRVDIINDSYFVNLTYTMIKALVPKKIRERVRFHSSSMETLRECYPPCILPDEYGGSLGPLSNDHWMDKVDQFLTNPKLVKPPRRKSLVDTLKGLLMT